MYKKQLYSGNVWLFPFETISFAKKIVVWGFGNIGKTYYKQIRESSIHDKVFFVDTNAEKFNLEYLHQPSVINDIKPDAVVIAIADYKTVCDIKSELRDMGYTGRIVVAPVERFLVENISSLTTLILDRNEAIDKYSYPVIKSWEDLRKKLHIYRVKDKELVRIGSRHDGGYIMLNDFHPGIAYSFGVAGNVEWEDEMMKKGYRVEMYDPTVQMPDNYSFHKIGIIDTPIDMDSDYRTIKEILLNNGDEEEKNMILKMDVEGAEWGFLAMTDSEILNQFSQIVMELHGLLSYNGMGTALRIPYIDKLLRTHSVVHVHPNNIGEVIVIDGMLYPGTLEVTFVNRERYSLEDAGDVILPLDIDSPCGVFDEIQLGKWNGYSKKGW